MAVEQTQSQGVHTVQMFDPLVSCAGKHVHICILFLQHHYLLLNFVTGQVLNLGEWLYRIKGVNECFDIFKPTNKLWSVEKRRLEGLIAEPPVIMQSFDLPPCRLVSEFFELSAWGQTCGCWASLNRVSCEMDPHER